MLTQLELLRLPTFGFVCVFLWLAEEPKEEEAQEIKAKPKAKGFGFGNIFADGGGASVLKKVKSKHSSEEQPPESKVKQINCNFQSTLDFVSQL